MTVLVKDANGFHTQCITVSLVVDEAILALTNYQLRGPAEYLYAIGPSYLSSIYSRAALSGRSTIARQRTSQNAVRDGLGVVWASTPPPTEAPAAEESAWTG